MNRLRNLMANILMLVVFITVPVVALAANAIDPDLVGLWHMDGDWSDSSGNANHGAGNNGATFNTNRKIGAFSGSFDGVNDYVNIPDATSLDISDNISIEAWIYPKADYTGYAVHLINKWGGDAVNTANYVLYYFGTTSGANRQIRFYSNAGGVWKPISPVYTVSLNNWYHVALSYTSAGGGYLYVNGVSQGPPVGSGSLQTNTYPLRFGGTDGSAVFNGLIDDVAIYKRALTAEEIAVNYGAGVSDPAAPPPPALGPIPSVVATSTIDLTGNSALNTSIWVNNKKFAVTDASGNWAGTYGTLQPGTNIMNVTALDSSSRLSQPTTVTVYYDNVPPTLAIDPVFTPSNQPVQTVTGTREAGSTVSVSSATASADSVTYPTVTTWSATVSAFVAGSNEIVVTAVDAAGNVTSASTLITYDTMPPAGTVIINNGEAITDFVQVQLALNATDANGISHMRFSSDGVNWTDPEVYAATRGWFLNPGDGTKQVYAQFRDNADNWSSPITASIILDTTPPAVGASPAGGIYNSTQSVALAANEPAVIYYTTDGSTPTTSTTIYSQPVSIPAGATLKYFGRDLAGNNSVVVTENYVIDTTPPDLAISTLSDGAYTNNEILNVAGTVTDDTGVTGITVNDTAAQENADGSFSYALQLKSGVNIITIVATDNAGNTAADTRTVTLDQTAPVLTVATPADNSKTGTALLEVSGTVDETSTVTVKMNDIVQSALMNGGAFTSTIILAPGYNTIEITATDLAGNQSSLKRTVVFDDQVPSLAVIAPNQDIRTNQSSLAIKGTVYDALTAVGVIISKGNEIFTPPVVDGTFEQSMNFTDEKTYDIVVTATNEAGTSTSVQRNVIYDITPPSLSIDPVTTPTSQSSLSVSGTREAGTEVTVSCATATVGEVSYPTATSWMVDIFGLSEGENAITAASADAAGNAVTATATVVLLLRPPVITITVTPDVIWPPNHKMVPVMILGGVETNGSDIKSVFISVRDEYGKIEYDNLTFGSTVMLEAWRKGDDTDGRRYTITVVITDKGGVTTAKTATVTVQHPQKFN